MCGALRSVAVSPHAMPWLAAMSEDATALPTPPSPRLASPRTRPSQPRRFPCLNPTTSLSERRASVRARHHRCPVTSAITNPSMVRGAPSTPLPPFSPGTLEPDLPLPLHPDAGPRRPPEPPPRRRTPPPSQFFHPSHRQEAPMSCHLHPLARRVASLSWMLERLPLLHLRHGSTTTSCAAMRARRAVTAPVCTRTQRRAVVGRAGRGRPGKAVGRMRYANGPSRHYGRGPRVTM
jgi:hypothetical protein